MRIRFNRYTIPAVMLLVCGMLPWARADIRDARLAHDCRVDTPLETVIEDLLEDIEAAGLPKTTVNRLMVAGYRESGGSETLRSLLCAMLEAENEGLPPDLLCEKLEEGLGKKVALARILPVVRAKIEDLKFARSLLRNETSDRVDDPEVARIARVLSLGVSRTDTAALFGSAYRAPPGMRVIAAEILGYGTVIGFDRQLLDRVIAAGLDHQAFSADWAYFIKVVTESRKSGIADPKTAATAITVLSENGSLEELVGELGLGRRVLNRLTED